MENQRTADEREKDALLILEAMNMRNCTSFTSDIFPPVSVSYVDAVKYFRQSGFSTDDAKVLAWALTFQGPLKVDEVHVEADNRSIRRKISDWWWYRFIRGFYPGC